MPILDPCPPSTDELSQGDLLHEIPLHHVELDGQPGLIGGKPLALVLSRDCAGANKTRILVAAVRGTIEKPPGEIKSFDDVRMFLTEMRDGDGAPDRFYLGHLSNRKGRFYAEIDSIHTIIIPDQGGRVEWLKKYRVARLSSDFIRHLQVKVFAAVARTGFDDYFWFADGDLDWLLSVGHAELNSLRTNLAEKEAEKARGAAAGQQENQGLQKSIAELSEKVATMTAQLAPYDKEKARRNPAPSGE